jgi:integrase
MDDRIYCSPLMFINSSESVKTRDAYRAALLEFCISKWSGHLSTEAVTYGRVALEKTQAATLLDDLSNYIRDPKRSDVLEDLQAFRTYLNNRKIRGRNMEGRPLAARTKKLHIAGVQSFLSMNEIRFQSRIHRNQFQIKERDEIDDLPFTIEKAQRVYHYLSPAMCGLFLYMISTGTRIQAAVMARVSDIDWQADPVRIRLRSGDAKTREAGFAFLTKECADYLRFAWLAPVKSGQDLLTKREIYMRGAGNRARGLQAQCSDRKAGERPDFRTDPRLFPMSHSTAYQALRTAIERAGFSDTNDKGYMLLHPHSTRKMFRNVMGRWGSADTAHTIMQHRPGRDAEYLTLSIEQCAADFKKAEPYLTIGISEEAREALTTRNAHAVAILELQNKVAELENFIENLEHFDKLLEKE